jgi:hypothetical protein
LRTFQSCYSGLFSSVAFFFALPAEAQTSTKILDLNRHGWYIYSGDHDIKGRWGVHFDGQWRRANVITAWQQYQARPGLNYRVNPNLLLTAGYAYTRTYPYGDFPVREAFPEHRIYQQALLKHAKQFVTLQQRFRLEQRFIRYPNTLDRSWTYQNRFRYMLKADFPIRRKPDGTRSWYLPIYNEVLIGIPPNYGARLWDQNRLFIGVGYSLGKPGNVEIGYLNQFSGQRNGRVFEFNSTLAVTFSSNYSFAGLFSGN